MAIIATLKWNGALPRSGTIHRFTQVSNAANSTITAADINVTNILPMLDNGAFSAGYNNSGSYGSLDVVNNWLDLRAINPNANILCRVTLTNNGVGSVANATLVMRLIPDITNPGVYADILNVPETFGTQAAFMTMAFQGNTDAVQIGIRTTQSENVRLNGVYLVTADPLN